MMTFHFRTVIGTFRKKSQYEKYLPSYQLHIQFYFVRLIANVASDTRTLDIGVQKV